MPNESSEIRPVTTDTETRNKAKFKEYQAREAEVDKAMERAVQSYDEACEEHRKTGLQVKDYMRNVSKETADAFYEELEAGQARIAKEFEAKATASPGRF